MSTVQIVLATGITLMAPVLWAALGELITETSGTMNTGIEGVMVLGAFVTAGAYYVSGSWLAGLGAAVLVGLLCALVLAVLYIRRGTDQIVTGIVFSAAAIALAAVLAQRWPGPVEVSSLRPVSVPVLADIPWLGGILFVHNPMVFGSLLAVGCVYLLMRHTWFGLHARAAGERPLVDEAAGVSVRGVRYTCLALGCVLTAVGGATLVLSTSSTFQPGITNGRGYIALAIVVLARWNPFGAAAAALLFGVVDAVRFRSDSVLQLGELPVQIVLMFPYLVAVVVVVLTRGSRYPSAVGVPYRPRSGPGRA